MYNPNLIKVDYNQYTLKHHYCKIKKKSKMK